MELAADVHLRRAGCGKDFDILACSQVGKPYARLQLKHLRRVNFRRLAGALDQCLPAKVEGDLQPALIEAGCYGLVADSHIHRRFKGHDFRMNGEFSGRLVCGRLRRAGLAG